MEKALKTIGFLLCVGILISTILHLIGVLEHADNVYMPCLMALMFVQALRSWKTNKFTALVSLIVGIFLLVLVCDHFLRMFLF